MNETHAGPTHANPQSEHSLTRDTQWVGGSHKPTPYGDRLENASPQRIEKKQPTQNVPHCSNPQNPNQNPIEHPSTMSPASNTSKEAVTVGTRLFLPKTRVISQRHNQAPNAPAPTWNRQLLRPNHCSWPTKSKTWNQSQCMPVTSHRQRPAPTPAPRRRGASAPQGG